MYSPNKEYYIKIEVNKLSTAYYTNTAAKIMGLND